MRKSAKAAATARRNPTVSRVKPVETELGRKRAIDQSNCNKDFSCLKGSARASSRSKAMPSCECQSRRRHVAEEFLQRTADARYQAIGRSRQYPHHWCRRHRRPHCRSADWAWRLISRARAVPVLDNTGSAQKNGAATSHVRLAARPEDLGAVRITAGAADLLLACDMMVAAGPTVLSALERDVTRAVVNTYLQPMASFVTNSDIDFEGPAMRRVLRAALGDGKYRFHRWNRLSHRAGRR